MKKVSPVQKHVVEEVTVCFSGRNPDIKKIGRDLDGEDKIKATIIVDDQASSLGMTNIGELQQLELTNLYVGDAGLIRIYGRYHGIEYDIEVKTRRYIESIKGY